MRRYRIIIWIVLLFSAVQGFSQSRIEIPPRIQRMIEKAPYYQKKAKKLICGQWKYYYGYSKKKVYSILDTTDILILHRLVNNYHNRKLKQEIDYGDPQQVLSSLAELKKFKRYSPYYYSGEEYMGSPLDAVPPPWPEGEIKDHHDHSNEFEQPVMTIAKMGYKLVFRFCNFLAWWVVLPDDTMVVYYEKDNKLYDPEEFLKTHITEHDMKMSGYLGRVRKR